MNHRTRPTLDLQPASTRTGGDCTDSPASSVRHTNMPSVASETCRLPAATFAATAFHDRSSAAANRVAAVHLHTVRWSSMNNCRRHRLPHLADLRGNDVSHADFRPAESGIVVARSADGGNIGKRHPGLRHGLVRPDARGHLTNARFDYDYVDVDRDDEAKRFVLAMNDRYLRFPIVVVQHRVVTQPTVAIVKRLLEEYGLQPETPKPPVNRSGPQPQEQDES